MDVDAGDGASQDKSDLPSMCLVNIVYEGFSEHNNFHKNPVLRYGH